MNKIICKSIEFVFLNEIKLFIPGQQVLLHPGMEFKKLPVTEKPVYRSDIKNEPAGAVNDEIITAVTKYDEHSLLRKFISYPIVLRMKTDKETFYVGSQNYPVVVELSSNKIFDTYTFSCKSEA